MVPLDATWAAAWLLPLPGAEDTTAAAKAWSKGEDDPDLPAEEAACRRPAQEGDQAIDLLVPLAEASEDFPSAGACLATGPSEVHLVPVRPAAEGLPSPGT